MGVHLYGVEKRDNEDYERCQEPASTADILYACPDFWT